MIEGDEAHLYGARKGSPLVVGWGDGEMFLGSDALAVGPFTNRVSYLDEGDFVAIDRTSARIFDAAGRPVERPARIVAAGFIALILVGNCLFVLRVIGQEIPEWLRIASRMATAGVIAGGLLLLGAVVVKRLRQRYDRSA